MWQAREILQRALIWVAMVTMLVFAGAVFALATMASPAVGTLAIIFAMPAHLLRKRSNALRA